MGRGSRDSLVVLRIVVKRYHDAGTIIQAACFVFGSVRVQLCWISVGVDYCGSNGVSDSC